MVIIKVRKAVMLYMFSILNEIFANFINHMNTRLEDNFSVVSDATVDIITCCFLQPKRNIVLSGVDSALFIVIASTSDDVEKYLLDLKSGPFWSIYRPYFFLDRSNNDKYCKNAQNVLQMSWKYNLLDVFYLCNKHGDAAVWTFNPFMNDAPNTWTYYQLSKKPSMHWSLYYREYNHISTANICSSFQWDKAKKLNGFSVKLSGLSEYKENTAEDLSSMCRQEYNHSVNRIVLDYLNVSVVLSCVTMKEVGEIDQRGQSTGMFRNLALGILDLLINPLLMRYAINITQTPQNFLGELKFIVLEKDNILAINSILQYLGYKFIIAVILITLLTAIILRYFIKQSIASLALEIVRLLTERALIQLPTTSAPRLYFLAVFIFYIVFQEIFQGRLSTLLTLSFSEKNLDTVEDLKSHVEYKIYIPRIMLPFIDEEIQARSIAVNDTLCNQYILNDPRAVCIGRNIVKLEQTESQSFHSSKESLITNHYCSLTRKDWPLQIVFEKALIIIIETGHVKFWTQNHLRYNFASIKSFNDLINQTNFSALSLNQLAFIFWGLVIGNCIATIVFFAEIKFWKKLCHIIKYDCCFLIEPSRKSNR